ncbi:Metallo-dependent phosphatase-like protein [Lentinula aciculospora]|uniref:Metallo-dependent phosphatase-like protein n=1 Tax=Lentinula aciculospora TaxID=153920 RepID=A0A9W9A089_9AGAR|nr:Metallo-dependent phosphatase-like protein [Lentinula aciculospora]
MALQKYVTLRSPRDKEIVYLEYDPSNLPPPSSGYTRFVCISDTHTRLFPVPDGDVLLHSGDLTNTGTVEEFEKTMNWIYELPHKLKIIIAGNHDLPLHIDWYELNHHRWSYSGHSIPQDHGRILELLKGNRAREANVVYLQDERYTFQAKNGGRLWSVYGSPWSPEFYNWAFGYTAAEGPSLISKFQISDILLTHGPPRNILDRTNRGDFPGCSALAAALLHLRPRLHLFGHIHEAHGAHIHSWSKGNVGNVQNYVETDDPMTGHYLDEDDNDVTVFVNAANWPMGQRKLEYQTNTFGGSGFRPVVVDMLD